MGNIFNKPRALWASRRGMLELDLFLTTFVESQFDTLSLSNQQLFFQLALEPDPHLFAWLMEHQPCPQEYKSLVQSIREARVFLHD